LLRFARFRSTPEVSDPSLGQACDPVNRSLGVLLLAASLCGIAIARRPAPLTPAPAHLPPVTALGLTVDTLLLGGHASGGFGDALHGLASDLSGEERELVGQHLERIFAGAVGDAGLSRTGRLRVAYERARRPDGTTRSIRVLGAEVAVAGRLHTAYYFERDGAPAYFDPFGRSLEAQDWGDPVRVPVVSSAFGDRRLHPLLNRVLPHTGVDLAAPHGEPVRATADGIIAWAGERGGYGLMVEIQHPNGYSTRYAHLSRVEASFSSARLVRRGDVIGHVGMSGLATGPHLHYEVRQRGRPIDPLRLALVPAVSESLAADPRWSLERRRIGALLAGTPTVVPVGNQAAAGR
jgi:murein DD-endopeptidase MepM/ murein hydrolase activator NlpD